MKKLHNPATMQWEVTAECNHDCIHCYNYWRKDSEKLAGLSWLKTEEEYLEIANAIVKINPVAVTITGGEPLLVFERIKSSIKLLRSAGIVLTINTNAALLTDEICEFIKENGVGLFISFISSDAKVFDSIVNREGAQAKVIKGMDLARSYGIPFNNNIVVSMGNIDTVENTIDFLNDRYHSGYISVTRVGKPINSDDTFNPKMLDKENFERLQDIIVKCSKKHKDLTIGTSCPYTPCSLKSQEAFDLYGYERICTAGKTSFSIDTDGNFKACPRDSRLYGNILVNSFDEVYEMMHEWRDGSFIPDECKKCKELSRCLGGCRVDSIPFTGKSNSLDRISDPNNIPLKFTKEAKKRDFTGISFRLNDNVRCLKNDEESFRLSSGRRYVIIKKKLYDFLMERDNFSCADISDYFNKDNNIATNVAARLLNEGIIVRI